MSARKNAALQTEHERYVASEIARTDRLRALRPKCGWVTGYHHCDREGCQFPRYPCAEVKRDRD